MVKYRKLNKNETYCCSVKAAKNAFSNEEIDIFFGYIIWSRFEDENNNKYRSENSSERIVASLHICDIEIEGIKVKPFLVFYILKKSGITKELRSIFEKEVLKNLLNVYKDKKCGKLENNCTITVGLKDGMFSFFER